MFSRQRANRGLYVPFFPRIMLENGRKPPFRVYCKLIRHYAFPRLSAIVFQNFPRSRFALCRNLFKTRLRIRRPSVSNLSALASSLRSAALARCSCFITLNMPLHCNAVKRYFPPRHCPLCQQPVVPFPRGCVPSHEDRPVLHLTAPVVQGVVAISWVAILL